MENAVEQGCFLTLAGDFNPAIFTPHWMASQSIISGDEADASEIEVVHRELARFTAANLRFDILPTRCLIFAEAEPFARLIDTTALLFLKALSHTPIRGIALNYYVHVDLRDTAKRTRFGRAIAPSSLWEEVGLMAADEDGTPRDGGVSNLTIQQPRHGGKDGFIQATVQPSYRIEGNKGLFVQVTDQYGLLSEPNLPEEEEKTPSSGRAKKRAKLMGEELAAAPIIHNYVADMKRDFDSALQNLVQIASGVVAAAERS